MTAYAGRVRSLATCAFLVLAACAPASVAEAEARKDIEWLDRHGSRASMEALGRLADHEHEASERLAAKRGNADVYHSAWLAHTRGASWGDELLRTALRTPSELPLAVSAMPSKDPRLSDFAEDLEKGVKAASGEHAASAVALLGSFGAQTEERLVRLIDREETREAACTGLASADVTREARLALTRADSDSLNHPACLATLFQHATSDLAVLEWMGHHAHTEVITQASRDLPCTTLSKLWERVLGSGRDSITELEPAIVASASRCPKDLDPTLARTLPSVRGVRKSVLNALLGEEAHAEHLEDTCKQLPRLAHGVAASEDVRALAKRVYDLRCQHPSH